MVTMNNVIVLISGEGMTLQSLLDKCQFVNVVGVISNNPNANGLERAKQAGVPIIESYSQINDIQNSIDNVISVFGGVKFIVLAGFMKILPKEFIKHFNDRQIHIINIHPSLLPKYKGLHTHKRVLEAGDAIHG